MVTNFSDFYNLIIELSVVNSLILILAFPVSDCMSVTKSKSLFNLNIITYQMEVSTHSY